MNILLTGGSGFIGSHLATALHAAGHVLHNFDLRPAADFPGQDQHGDVRDVAALSRAVIGMDLVIHLAAEHADDVTPESRYADTNVRGAQHLVQAIENAAVSRVLLFSSASVYGLGDTTEQAPLSPHTPYGHSKVAAEQLLSNWQSKAPSERALRILRPCVVYGPGHHGNMRRLIDAVDRPHLVLVGSGRNTKSICYVGNLVAATLFDLAMRPGLHIHNVADTPDLDMHSLTRLIRTELGRDPDAAWRVPMTPALAFGHVCDLIARVGGPRLELSAARVRKFCSSTSLTATNLLAAGYRAPFDHVTGIRATLSSRARSDA